MKLVKAGSGTRKSKDIAFRGDSVVKPYFNWNYTTSSYEFIIEFYDNATGTKYKVVGSQTDWEQEIAGLQDAMTKAPA